MDRKDVVEISRTEEDPGLEVGWSKVEVEDATEKEGGE